MTAGPTFFVRHDPRWHEMPMAGDVDAWADQASRAAWDVSGREPSEAALRTFGEHLASLCEWTRTIGIPLAFVFTPEPWAGPTTVVMLLVETLPGDGTRDELATLFAVPEAALAEPQEVDDLDTDAGPAVRVRQRRVTVDDEGRRVVTEHLQYAWPDRAQGVAMVAVTSFGDLVAAGRWAGAIDDLARGMTFADD
jgi:hypothetical protein